MPATSGLSRRPALGLAAAVAILVIVALGALAANLGLLSTAPSAAGKVGQLDGTNVGSLVSASSTPASTPAAPAVVDQPAVDRATSHESDEGDDHGGDRSDSDHRGSGSSEADDDD